MRKFRSVSQYALAGSSSRLIQPQDLPAEIRRAEAAGGAGRKLDRETVAATLAQCGGNKTKAARLPGIGRATLYRFLSNFP